MSSEYFTFSTPLARNTLARAEAVNALFTSLEASLANIPGSTLLLEDRVTYAADTGAANAYVVTLATAPPSGYVDGLTVHFKTSNANTGASTINVNGLGVKQIRDFNGDPLEAGTIPAGGIVTVRYDGSYFRLNTVATSVTPSADSVSTATIQDNAVTEAKIGDAEVKAIAGLTSAADRLPYFTGSGTASLATFTAAARSLLDDASVSAMRTTLGLAIGTDVQAFNGYLADIAAISPGAGSLITHNGSDYVDLPMGTALQALRVNAGATALEFAEAAGGSIGTHTIYIPGQAFTATHTSGAVSFVDELATNDIMSRGYIFSASLVEKVQFVFQCPKSVDVSENWAAELLWIDDDTAGSGDVVWTVSLAATRDGSSLDRAPGTKVSVTDTFQGTEVLHEVAFSGIGVAGTLAKEDTIIVEVNRTGTHGSDTYTQDALFLGLRLSYQTDAENDD